MSLTPDDALADPPAYTPTAPLPPAPFKRTLDDTRTLILANAALLRPHVKTGPIDLVIGKTRGAAAPSTYSSDSGAGRSFVSTTSNVTIRIAPTPSAIGGGGDEGAGAGRARSGSRTPSERRPSDTGGRIEAGKHYAALVSRTFRADAAQFTADVIILGEPQGSVEEALEWMLDRTEAVVTDVLASHRRQVSTVCCRSCGQGLRGE